MCGITGVVDFTRQQAGQHICAMTQTLRHRGPDDEGYALFRLDSAEVVLGRGEDSPSAFSALPSIATCAHIPADLALGHRRLSIIDLSPAGHNPLSSADGALWITYNGEIYNYLELRAELIDLGHTFQTATDTEVLLMAYAQWGVECLPRLNGMFAFAIWDRRQGRLFCARDRFGIKPFYFFREDGFFAFASEIKALLAHPRAPRCANQQAVYDYLVNGAVGSFFEGVEQLPGSHALTLDAEGRLHTWRYYDIMPNTRFSNPADQAAEFRHLLTDAVRLRLRSDVLVGSSLSGGLDSSSVVTLANQLLQQEQGVNRAVIGEKQKVFCAVYDGERFDEKSHMDTVISATGTAAHFTRPDSDKLWAELEKLVWHQDEPFNSTAIFAQYCVMGLARQQGVTVLLDGQGADEVLGGYHHYYGYFLANALGVGRWDRALREAFGARRVAGVSWAALVALAGYNLSPAPLRNLGWKLAGSKMLSHKPIAPSLLEPLFAAQHQGQAALKHRAYRSLSQKLYDDVFNTSLPALLRYEDRSSMAFHIEARVPFLDYRLVDFAFSLGADAHIRDGWSKAILRDAMQGLLPEKTRLRRDKEGYTTPHERWMQELTPQINALFGGEVRARAYLGRDALEKLRSPAAGSVSGVWRLVNLEAWLRAFDLA